MTHRKHPHDHGIPAPGKRSPHTVGRGEEGEGRTLEIVLKCDSFGTAEAVSAILKTIGTPEAYPKVIYTGVGEVSKSDLLMALTGGRLVIGFDVGTAPRLDHLVKEHGVEVRLYNVIYTLARDLEKILQSLSVPQVEEVDEITTGTAKVIALFKSGHKGIIAGCEVLEGSLVVGRKFRAISAMGPVYSGRIESLQIEKKPVHEARVGQQVGLKISDFNRVKLGDLVECFEKIPSKRGVPWRPSGSVIRIQQ